jgi:hypothetical protein
MAKSALGLVGRIFKAAYLTRNALITTAIEAIILARNTLTL